MKHSPTIKFLTREEINSEWWDHLLLQSNNALIYAESGYLDRMSPDWCAFHDEDTMSIMPFPLQRKMGISYALQPMFMQQSGVYSCNAITELLTQAFIAAAREKAALIDINFNYNNPVSGAQQCTNLILDLNRSFDDIKKHFHRNLKRNIKEAESYSPVYAPADIAEIFEIYEKTIFKKTNQTKEILARFQAVCNFYHKKDRVICRKLNSVKGDLLSATLYLRDAKRIYSMLLVNSDEGKTKCSNAFLISELIREFSGSALLLDFTGSEIPGVKAFFEKFNPDLQPYPRVQINRLNEFQNTVKSIRDLFRK